MKILIFGGAGYIGAHVVIELLDAGFNVVVFDNFSTGEKLNIDSRAEIFEGDILSNRDLKNVFNIYEIDSIMHLCGLKAAGESMVDPTRYSEINLIGSINIINHMVKNNISKFIFSSSASIYGSPLSSKIKEDHPLSPINYYGFTKLQIEQVLNWYSKVYNLRYVSLRYFNAAGYDLKSRIKIPEKNSANLIPKIMEVILGKKEKLKVFGNNYQTIDGTCVRDYIHVTDIALAHIESLKYLENKNNKSIALNLATGKGHSVLEVLKTIENTYGGKIPYEIAERRKGDSPIVISETLFKNSPIKWKPLQSDLEVIIKSVLNTHNISYQWKKHI
jgi:UDP-glucose 4-epimerase